MKYAMLSSDSTLDYLALLPITCFSWSRLGYSPEVILVNVPYAYHKIIQKYSPKNTRFLPFGTFPGIKDSTAAQVLRLLHPTGYAPDDIVITGDADMLVMKDIFNDNGEICSYGFDLTGRSEIPICYVKATAMKWRELMQVKPGQSRLKEFLGEFEWRAKSEKWEEYWSVDQQLLTSRAFAYGLDKITFIDRGHGAHGLPIGRWDRYKWDSVPDDIIDVHMPRSPLSNWGQVVQMCNRLWPTPGSHEWDWLYAYYNELVGVGKTPIVPQDYLNTLKENDEFGFLQDHNNWSNHRGLLLLALSLTQGNVIEYGSGEGSTSHLRNFCEKNKREFATYDSNSEWAQKTGSKYIENWDSADVWHKSSVAFMDLAPGEYRHVAVQKLMDKAEIIVCHDSELNGAGDYRYEPVFSQFKYVLHYNRTAGGAGTTALSNTVNLTKYAGFKLGQYQFE